MVSLEANSSITSRSTFSASSKRPYEENSANARTFGAGFRA